LDVVELVPLFDVPLFDVLVFDVLVFELLDELEDL
jgi:hypothetical protein